MQAFDTGGSSSYSRSSPPKDPFNRFKKNVQETEDKLPSYRDWQVNRLQPSTQDGSNNYNTSTPPNGHAANLNARSNHNSSTQVKNERPAYSNSRIPPNAVVTTGPVTYSQGPREGGTAATRVPYAISTRDGQAKYEAKSHAYRQQDYSSAGRVAGPSAAAPWQHSYGEHNSGYGTNESQLSRTSAVPPNELRRALERVSNNVNQQSYGTNYYQSSDSGHDTSADTVV